MTSRANAVDVQPTPWARTVTRVPAPTAASTPRDEPVAGRGGAETLIQRFGSVANLDIHRDCRVRDGVYRCGGDGPPSCVEVDASTDDELNALLQTPTTRLMKRRTHQGVLVEEMRQSYLAEPVADGDGRGAAM